MSYYHQKRSDRSGRPATMYSSSRNKKRQPKKAYIHPSKFVQSARPRTEEEYTPTYSFTDFAMHPLLQQNIASMGFTTPSPIQDQTIPVGLAGSDVVGIANTGTGKTAAFAVPLLHKLITEPRSKAIILAPTRELAQQIEEQCRSIAKDSGLYGALLIGGTPMGPQLRSLNRNPRIIIGTPGRIKDHLERHSLDLADCNVVVLDEVDRMLDMGFVDDITYILGRTNTDKQSFYFSATLDKRVEGIIRSFSTGQDPVHISVKSGETSDNVEQNIVPFTSANEKIDKLHDVLVREATGKTIIFDDTQRSVERLSKELGSRGFQADSLHGGKSQSQRQRVLNRFKNDEITVLVATDVAARGLDVSDISHVINYSSPQTYEDYVHRIGRTGRAGKIGYALTFVES
ncbi:MAG TPA: DEAD/DEAH box helicase [Candidatus Saccharimonadales bacterium]|nr:DEAD/DEAH box helicase [Candidatus Saccharimonadales bacterium]